MLLFPKPLTADHGGIYLGSVFLTVGGGTWSFVPEVDTLDDHSTTVTNSALVRTSELTFHLSV